MTNAQVKDMKRYLRSCRILRREERLLHMRLADLERMIRLPALHPEKVEPGSLEILAAQRRAELLDLTKRVLERCREIEGVIEQAEGEGEDKTQLYRQILRLRYVDGLSFAEIAGRLNYHERHVHRLHREGLAAAARTWKGGEGLGEHME